MEHYQYKFIMNALRDGWTVSMLNDSFEFTKKRTNGVDEKEYEKPGYSSEFLKKYGEVKIKPTTEGPGGAKNNETSK